MKPTYGGFSKESTSEAQALINEAEEWRARTSACSSTSRWDHEITMTVSQLLSRGSLVVVATAALAVLMTASRQIGAVSVPPEVIGKEVRYLDHRTRRMSPLPTEDCETLEHCEKCDKWHGEVCSARGQRRIQGSCLRPARRRHSVFSLPAPISQLAVHAASEAGRQSDLDCRQSIQAN